MSRTSLMRSLQRLGQDQRIANAQGVDVNAVREKRAELASSDYGLSRRAVLKGALMAGAGAAVLGSGLVNPSAAAATPAKKNPKSPRIAVVGGGIAGLSAALGLKDAGYDGYTVYEANPTRLGGRIWTNKNGFWGNGQITEWGGELIDTSHADMHAFAARYGLTMIDILDTPYEETYFFDDEYYSGEQALADYAAVEAAIAVDIASFEWPVAWDAKNTRAGVALSRMNVYDWIETRVPGGHDSNMGRLLDVAYCIEYGADTRDQSAIGLLGLLGFYNDPTAFSIFGTSDERYRILGGNDQIIDNIANEIGRNKIATGYRLEALRKNADGSMKLTFNTGGAVETVTADYVIMALPITIMRDISLAGGFGPKAGFHPRMDALLRAYPMGSNNKIHMQFKNRVWNDIQNSNGSAYSDTGFQASWEPTSKQPGRTGILVQYPGGSLSLAQQKMSASAFASSESSSEKTRREVDAIARKALAQMEPVFPGLSAQYNGKATISLWGNNPYAKGAYSYYAPGYPDKFAGYEAVPQGNVYFSGEYVDMDEQGYMCGAAGSGFDAATALVDYLATL